MRATEPDRAAAVRPNHRDLTVGPGLMPELPEVEVVRRGLSARLPGRVLQALRVRERRLRWPVESGVEAELEGRKITAVGRRGKYLLIGFEQGTLISHLGMSGSWRWVASAHPPAAHDHIDLVFETETLRYHDPRRFGSLHWHPLSAGLPEQHPLLARLGVEPLSDGFDAGRLYRESRGRTLSVKQFLLAGHTVVGVGNIYASEALHRAGVRPTRRAGSLSRVACERLVREIRATLQESIERGGSTLRDFVASDGAQGYFQASARVYGRSGEPCLACGTRIREIRQQQRSTFYCAVCQR